MSGLPFHRNDLSGDVGDDETIADPVGATARATAAARARETERSDRLFVDPFAAALAGSEGFEALDRHNSARSETDAVVANPVFAIRTRFFDDFVLADAVKRQTRQVVLVAAGLDTRAFQLQWPLGVRLYELDQPEVLAYKHGVLASAKAVPNCVQVAVGVDLREPWAPTLLMAGFRLDQRSIWLAEGLTFYLDEASVRRLFQDIAALTSDGDQLGTDFVSASPPSFENLIRFTTHDPIGLLRACGWEGHEISYAHEAKGLGRAWPYSGPPKGCIVVAVRTLGAR